MTNTVSINSDIAKELVASIRELKAEISALKKILKKAKYGSKEWWLDELENGEAEISSGNYKIYKNAKSLIADLHKGI